MYSERLIQRIRAVKHKMQVDNATPKSAIRRTALGAHSCVRYNNVGLLRPKLSIVNSKLCN
jgi:hypothetical protein